jgi:hypothetical protein
LASRSAPLSRGVNDYAQRLHGTNLPLGVVAYSVYEDLSIVGMAEFEACGALAHELVHLAIRQNFGDSPAWLEEGLASEVAVAHPESDRMPFGRSWRDDILKRHWSLRLTVAQLLPANWTVVYLYPAGNSDRPPIRYNPPFTTGVRGLCHDSQPRFLPARADRPGVGISHALLVVAIGARRSSTDTTHARDATTQTLHGAQTLSGSHPETLLRCL